VLLVPGRPELEGLDGIQADCPLSIDVAVDDDSMIQMGNRCHLDGCRDAGGIVAKKDKIRNVVWISKGSVPRSCIKM